ncbi:MAG: DUF6263 family protein [Planctomycetota bacterium]
MIPNLALHSGATMETHMSIARTLSLAAVLSAPLFAQDAQKHLLRYRFQAGQTWDVLIEQEMKMAMDMGGQAMNTTMLMSMFTANKVAKVEDGKASLEQKITRIKAKMDMGIMNVDFDSADPDSDAGMMGPLADLVDSVAKVSLTANGKMGDVKLSDALKDQMAQSGMDLKQMMSQASVELPEKPIAIGESWTTKSTVKLGQMGETTSEVVNKLISVDNDYFVLEQTVKVDTSETEMPGGMELEDLTMKGTNKISFATGMSREMNMLTKMAMSGQADMEMEMKMTMKPAPKKKAKKDAEEAVKEEVVKTETVKETAGAGK